MIYTALELILFSHPGCKNCALWTAVQSMDNYERSSISSHLVNAKHNCGLQNSALGCFISPSLNCLWDTPKDTRIQVFKLMVDGWTTLLEGNKRADWVVQDRLMHKVQHSFFFQHMQCYANSWTAEVVMAQNGTCIHWVHEAQRGKLIVADFFSHLACIWRLVAELWSMSTIFRCIGVYCN